jgi:hypothetical protein
MKVHALKTLPEFFIEVGVTKFFEVRKDDRNYQVGDILWLQEWTYEDSFTGESKRFKVTFLSGSRQDSGIKEGYCVMSITPITQFVFEAHSVASFENSWQIPSGITTY